MSLARHGRGPSPRNMTALWPAPRLTSRLTSRRSPVCPSMICMSPAFGSQTSILRPRSNGLPSQMGRMTRTVCTTMTHATRAVAHTMRALQWLSATPRTGRLRHHCDVDVPPMIVEDTADEGTEEPLLMEVRFRAEWERTLDPLFGAEEQ